MVKKEDERILLRNAFSKNEFDLIESGERPDFRLVNTEKDHVVGCEVTEFHYDQTKARLAKKPSYRESIIKGEGGPKGDGFLHKDDYEKISVGKVKIVNPRTNEQHEVDATFGSEVDLHEYVSSMSELIQSKASKLTDYELHGSGTYLVIGDFCHACGGTPSNPTPRKNIMAKLLETTNKSGFLDVIVVVLNAKPEPFSYSIKRHLS